MVGKYICDRFWENRPKCGIQSFLIYSTSRLHGAFVYRPPNLEAVAQDAFALRTVHFSIFARLITDDFEKTPGKGVAKIRGRALCPYTITACLRDTNV